VYPATKDVRQYKTTTPARMDPLRVVEIIPVNAKPKWKNVNTINWFPIPTQAQKNAGYCGNRKTSP
jgi:hypothetical protein